MIREEAIVAKSYSIYNPLAKPLTLVPEGYY
jgi:hypothetical protein